MRNIIMNYDPKELETGVRIEHEHTKDDALARKIAMDHLREDPHYYTKLKAAGLEEEGAMTPLESGMAEHCGEPGCESHPGEKGAMGKPGEPVDEVMGDAESDETMLETGIGIESPMGAVEIDEFPPFASMVKSSIAVVEPPEQSPLVSSGLGTGTPKPLTSDKLDAPETAVVSHNNTVKYGKTSNNQQISAPDQYDHFFGQAASLGSLEEGVRTKK